MKDTEQKFFNDELAFQALRNNDSNLENNEIKPKNF